MKELCLKYGIVVCPKSEPTRQMVLGTDSQEKEAPHEGSPSMVPAHLPGAPSLYLNMPLNPEAPLPQKPTQVCPLVENGEFGPTQVHKPFSS